MKKILILTLTVVSVFLLLTACSDPVADEFENFLNVQMADVNANYAAITTEAGNWANFTTDTELITSLEDNLIPKCDETLEMLSKIEPVAEEIKALKSKFVNVIELYKEGFSTILTGIKAADEATMLVGNEKLTEGIALLDEYNKALEDLAAQFGSTLEY